VDLALWFFGDLKVDSAKLESLIDNGSEDHAYFTTEKSGGLEGEFDVSWCMKNYRLPEVGFSIRGSKGIIGVNDDKLEVKLNSGKSSTWYRHDLDDNVPFFLGGPEYFREDAYFFKTVIEHLKAEPSFCTASQVDQIIDEVKHRAG